jgi:adenylate cyclase
MDDGDGRCHFLLGAIHRYRGDVDSAEWHYQKARALNPNDANTIVAYARILVYGGHLEEGLRLIRQGMRLNPYHPEWYWLNLGAVLYEAGKYSDAVEALGRIASPGYWVHCRLADCYAQLDRMTEAKAEAAAALRLRPDFKVSTLQLRECRPEVAERIRGGLRKAGLPG